MSSLNYLDCFCKYHVYKLATFQTILLLRIDQDNTNPKYDLIIFSVYNYSILNLGRN